MKNSEVVETHLAKPETGLVFTSMEWTAKYTIYVPVYRNRHLYSNNFNTVMCLSIGTLKILNFPFVPNGKFIVFRCPKI